MQRQHTESKTGNGYLQFDITLLVRAIACLIIIWYHVGPPTRWLIVGGRNFSFLTYPNPTAAVFIFYLLSGYGVGFGFSSGRYTKSFRSLVSYYVNRIVRIVPAYYVNILLCMFLFYPNKTVTTYDLIRFFTFTSNFDHWSVPFQAGLAIVSTEVQFYIIAPVLFWILRALLKRVSIVWVGVLTLASGIVVRYALAHLFFIGDRGGWWTENIYITVWGNIDFFLFGMFISYLVSSRADVIFRLQRYMRPILFYPVLLLWSLGVMITNFVAGFQASLSWTMYVLPTSLCLVVGWLIASNTVGKKYFRIGGLRPDQIMKLITGPKTMIYTFGMLSYGVYLYHYVFLDRIFGGIYSAAGVSVGDGWSGFAIKFSVVSALAILAAILSYTFIEYPVMFLKRRFSNLRKT